MSPLKYELRVPFKKRPSSSFATIRLIKSIDRQALSNMWLLYFVVANGDHHFNVHTVVWEKKIVVNCIKNYVFWFGLVWFGLVYISQTYKYTFTTKNVGR